jgi:hypothetical protein
VQRSAGASPRSCGEAVPTRIQSDSSAASTAATSPRVARSVADAATAEADRELREFSHVGVRKAEDELADRDAAHIGAGPSMRAANVVRADGRGGSAAIRRTRCRTFPQGGPASGTCARRRRTGRPGGPRQPRECARGGQMGGVIGMLPITPTG